VLVMPPRGSEPVKAWVTVFIDVKTRAVMGWSINIEKSSADVLMALRKAVRLEPEHGPFCGAPDVVIWDNGGEFLADAVTQAALGLQILPRVAKPYMPHLKGVVERFNRTLEQSFVSTLPGYVHGAKTIKGDPYEGQGLLSYEHLVALFEEFIDDYNHNHAHRSLGGISPKQAWEDDPAMLRTYDDDELRWITLPGETRVIGSRGIEFRAAFFVAPEISTLVGEQVTVHFMPHDLRKVEVWHDGKFLCEAYPRDMLTAEQREQFFAQRSREKRAAGETRKRSNRKLRARYAPMDSAGTPQEITQITEAQARAEDALRIDADLSDAGSLDLLDQTGLNQPLADENDGEL
jgi:putative transposase